MPKIKVNDISMYYEIHGEGQPLFFVGGFGVDHMVWYSVLDFFKHKYQVILCDNRGAGQTDVPLGPYSIAQMAKDYADLCATIGIQSAHFVGNSMGGLIVQQLCKDYPQLVKSAVLSNTVGYCQTAFSIFLDTQFELIRAQAPMKELIKAACAWIYSYRFLSQAQNIDLIVELTLSNPFPFTETAFAGQKSAVANFDARTWLKELKTPTLVFGSDQDLIFLESFVKEFAQQVPNAHYYSFQNCGHLPYIEYRELFANKVLEFIGTGR